MQRKRKRRSDWEGRDSRLNVKINDAEVIALDRAKRETGLTWSQLARRALAEMFAKSGGQS